MRSLLFVLLLLIIRNESLAQARRTIRVKAGEDLAKAYSTNGFYKFAEFIPASLYSRSGKKDIGLRFNYNYLSGNMQFISPSGDTLDIGAPASVESILFNDSTLFTYQEGFMERLAQKDSIQLYRKSTIKLQAENIGAYGQPTTTASVINYTSFYTGTNVYNLVVNQDMVIVETLSWFWKKGPTLLKANTQNLVDLLDQKDKESIVHYTKKNKINTDKESHLIKLLEAIPD